MSATLQLTAGNWAARPITGDGSRYSMDEQKASGRQKRRRPEQSRPQNPDQS